MKPRPCANLMPNSSGSWRKKAANTWNSQRPKFIVVGGIWGNLSLPPETLGSARVEKPEASFNF